MDTNWFSTRELAPNTWALIDPMGRLVPEYDVRVVNIFLVAGSNRAAVIDSGIGRGDLLGAIRALTDLPLISISTHSHWDHIGGANLFPDRRIHPLERQNLDIEQDIDGVGHIQAAPGAAPLNEGDVIDLGGRTLTVWHTPGHSPGHISLLDSATGYLFCGDTCYASTLWMQTDDANLTDWRATLERIASDSRVTDLCGGHGEPVQPPDLARRLLAALDQALAGHSQSEPFDFDPGSRKHIFDGFSILLREDVTP